MFQNNKLYKVATPETQYCFRPNLFMWPNRTLLFGPLQHLSLHSMGSIAINVGLYRPFTIKAPNGSHTAYRSAIIPAGCKHELNAYGNIMACLIIEKNSADFFNFKQKFPFYESSITEVTDPKWIECFQTIYQEKPSKIEINQILNQLLDTEKEQDKNIDPRIASIMQVIQDTPENSLSQEYLASLVGLSASRFRHLFRQQSDIPYRRYRIWRRIVSAMTTLNKVDNLTYAAMEAGFTDSAHFNRCFRDTFGVNPSLVFNNIDRFEV